MDKQTTLFYQQHARQITTTYQAAENGVNRHFVQAFPSGTCVLGIGSGSGRDLMALLDAGYDAVGLEPCRAMRLTICQRLRAV